MVGMAVACSSPQAATPTAAPTAVLATPTGAPAPTVAPTATAVRPTLTPVPTRAPEPSPTPAIIHVGNLNGQPVYLYNSPTIGDRIQIYPDGTPLAVVGGDVEGDGLMWHIVRAPYGTEGYVPFDDT